MATSALSPRETKSLATGMKLKRDKRGRLKGSAETRGDKLLLITAMMLDDFLRHPLVGVLISIPLVWLIIWASGG